MNTSHTSISDPLSQGHSHTKGIAGLFPARHVLLPEGYDKRTCPFYLAVEEYVAQHCPAFDADGRPEAYFFTWRLPATVVMGRNQVAHQEVDLDFCRREGIDITRRKSGGGAVFADPDNLMLSLITPGADVESTFQTYAHAVSEALRTLGAPTTVSGRNDIVLDPLTLPDGSQIPGGKVCGNAFYHLAERNIVHGTMLYDTNPRLMQGALHPDVSKLRSAGVKSVRSRVALLKDYIPIGPAQLRSSLIPLLTDRSVTLTPADIAVVEEMEKEYRTEEFLYGSSAATDVTLGGRVKGVGSLMLHFALKGSLVRNVTLTGDYFELAGRASEAFSHAFTGRRFTPEALTAAVEAHHPEKEIRNLTPEALVAILTNDPPPTPHRPSPQPLP